MLAVFFVGKQFHLGFSILVNGANGAQIKLPKTSSRTSKEFKVSRKEIWSVARSGCLWCVPCDWFSPAVKPTPMPLPRPRPASRTSKPE